MSYNPEKDMPKTLQEWNELIGYYQAKEPDKTRAEIEQNFACFYPKPEQPEAAPNFAELKQLKKAELDAAFYTACNNATVMTAGGWPADANDTAYRNVQGLLITMQNSSLETVDFCDADNNFHAVSQKDLEAIQQQIISLGQQLYAKKWQFRSAIEAAQTEAELNAVAVSF